MFCHYCCLTLTLTLLIEWFIPHHRCRGPHINATSVCLELNSTSTFPRLVLLWFFGNPSLLRLFGCRYSLGYLCVITFISKYLIYLFIAIRYFSTTLRGIVGERLSWQRTTLRHKFGNFNFICGVYKLPLLFLITIAWVCKFGKSVCRHTTDIRKECSSTIMYFAKAKPAKLALFRCVSP